MYTCCILIILVLTTQIMYILPDSPQSKTTPSACPHAVLHPPHSKCYAHGCTACIYSSTHAQTCRPSWCSRSHGCRSSPVQGTPWMLWHHASGGCHVLDSI